MSKKTFLLLLMFLTITGILIIGGRFLIWKNSEKKPQQPINFSHRIHTGKVGLKCIKCHQYAALSPRAGIPAVKICADCHQKVAKDKPEIKKLMSFWNKSKPIPWNKVHSLPWHVRFTHKRHIKAGIDCSVCHGDVRSMETVRQVRSLEMGWCVKCHKQNEASFDCLTCHK